MMHALEFKVRRILLACYHSNASIRNHRDANRLAHSLDGRPVRSLCELDVFVRKFAVAWLVCFLDLQ